MIDKKSKSPTPKHYCIRKEIFWLGILSLLIYIAANWWTHLNWPPHGESHPKEIQSLNCKLHDFTISKKEFKNIPESSQNSFVTDKKMFFLHPQCASFIYLKFENSGMRLTQYIYDIEKNRRTAIITTIFDKYEEN